MLYLGSREEELPRPLDVDAALEAAGRAGKPRGSLVGGCRSVERLACAGSRCAPFEAGLAVLREPSMKVSAAAEGADQTRESAEVLLDA